MFYLEHGHLSNKVKQEKGKIVAVYYGFTLDVPCLSQFVFRFRMIT